MTVYLQDPDVTIHQGDALEVLRGLADESVDCAATSPPFYGLRDYGVEGQIGLEASPDEWVARLVAVFGEVRRVLRPPGTLWLECGDSYVSGQGGRQSAVGEMPAAPLRIDSDGDIGRDDVDAGSWQSGATSKITPARGSVYKPKDLLGQPWLLAFALRADGWWLRQAIIWHKPNAMPESATDRCTTAHSYVFLFSKQARYWFDAEAIAEPAEWARWGDQTVPKYEGTETASGWMQPKTKAELQKAAQSTGNGASDRRREFTAATVHTEAAYPALKNARSVWTIPTKGYPEAHFATWPQVLVERILKAGCPEDGTVLDPFLGSGTTALVARKLGRRSIGIELNESYCELAAKRLGQQSLFAQETA